MGINFEQLILYEDNHLLVIYKPANILSQKDNTNDLDITYYAKKYLVSKYNKPGDAYLGLVHRLDRMTEGVMVLTKTSKAAARLSNDIKSNIWHKEYLCLVEGVINEEGMLKNFLTRTDQEKKMMVSNSGQEAILKYYPIKVFDDKTLLRIELITGRHHQIRVQMAHFNHPLVGDMLYGNSKVKQDLMLACYSITFRHPTSKEFMTIKELPRSSKWESFIGGSNEK